MSPMPRLLRIFHLITTLVLCGSTYLAAEPIRVTGRVAGLSDTGQARPLSGARVELFPAWEDYASAVKRLTEKGRLAPLRSTRTDAEGSFEIAVPEVGAYRLAVQAEGYLSEEISLLPVVEDLEVVTTALLPAKPIEARVLGADGRPLAGVAVRLSARERLAPWSQAARPTTWRLADQFGVSDQEGRLRFLGYPNVPGELELTAVSPEYLGQSASRSPGSSGLDLRLDPRQALWVEAQDPEGKPMPGALLRWPGRAVAVAGPDGRAKICLAGTEPLLLESREGWRGWIAPPAQGRTEALQVRLLPPGSAVGKVVDSRSGKPVSSALVWQGWPLLAPPARTDAEGAFRIEPIRGSNLALSSVAAGFFPGEWTSARPGAAEPVVLKLDPAAALAGVVVDAAGRPLSAVRISADPPRSRPGEPPDRAMARSRGDGGFLLTGLRPGGSYELTAARPGFGRGKTTARTAAAGEKSPPVRIVMSSGQTASGRIVDEEGQPVSGVGVELAGSMDSPPATAESDAEGRFELRHLDAGTVTLVLKAEGYAPLVRPQIEIPAAQPSTDLGTFTISRAVAIEGRVTDRRGGAIEGATVRVLPMPEDFAMARFFQPPEEPRTGPEGKFRVDGLRRGTRYNLRVEHPAYVATTAPGVQPPTEEPVRIEMEEAHSLAGRVTGPQGEPVAHAALLRVEEMRHGGGMSRGSSMLGETDSDGRFRATGLPSGPLLVEVAAETYANRREGLQMPENGDLDGVEIVLQRGAFLDVRVLDSKGRAQRGFFVKAEPQKPTKREDPFLFDVMGHVTDFEGRTRVPLPEPGVYRVVASRMAASVSESVTAVAGNTPVELRLPPGFEISGRVIGPDGEGVSEASIQVETADGGHPSTRTEADGTFVLSDLPDGEYRLKAEDRQGKASASRDVRIAGASVSGVELTLDRESGRATLTGHILGLSTEDLPRVRVTAYPAATAAGYPVSSRGVGADGAYKIEGLEPGEWRIEAILFGGGRTEAKAQIEPGAKAVLDLEFSKAFTLNGRVLLDGAPLAGAEITGATRSGSLIGGATTAWDGTFTLHHAEPGLLTLSLMRQDGIGAGRTVQVTEDKTLLIELSSGRLRGTAVSSTGEPVEGAEVAIEGQFDGGRSSFSVPPLRSEPDGTFEWPRLVAGKYQVKILKDGFAPAQATVEVPPGGEGMVEIRLTPKGGS